MQFEIKNRWTGEVQITAEIESSEYASYGINADNAAALADMKRLAEAEAKQGAA